MYILYSELRGAFGFSVGDKLKQLLLQRVCVNVGNFMEYCNFGGHRKKLGVLKNCCSRLIWRVQGFRLWDVSFRTAGVP